MAHKTLAMILASLCLLSAGAEPGHASKPLAYRVAVTNKIVKISDGVYSLSNADQQHIAPLTCEGLTQILSDQAIADTLENGTTTSKKSPGQGNDDLLSGFLVYSSDIKTSLLQTLLLGVKEILIESFGYNDIHSGPRYARSDVPCSIQK